MKSEDWQSQFKIVERELKRLYDYDVVKQTGLDDCADFSKKIIQINSRTHPEGRFYTLLHEYGHVELWEDDWYSFCTAVPSYAKFYSDRRTRSHAGKVATIAEELEAWKRGLMLSYRKALIVDYKKYEKMMNESMMTYIRWAADG